jgi:PAS domain S-box-containing protein
VTGRASAVAEHFADFANFAELIPHVLWVKASDGSIAYLNAKGREFIGPEPRPGEGWSWFDLVHPDDLARTGDAWQNALRSGRPYEFEARVMAADGAYHWVISRGWPARLPKSDTPQWVGTLTLIDDQKAQERRLLEGRDDLAEALSILDALQTAAPVGFMFLDPQLRFVRVNDTAAFIGGIPASEYLGRTLPEVLPALWPHVEWIYHKVAETRRPVINVELNVDIQGPRSTLLSAYPVSVGGNLRGFGVVFIDITERKAVETAQRDMTRGTVEALAVTVEVRDPYTAGHQRRVSQIARRVAERLGLGADEIEGVTIAGQIHDVGKVAVPAEILSKPGSLTRAEFELVKEHSRAGYEILKGIKFPWPVAKMVVQHHERLDGSGYPDGLRGEDILLGSRILAVADVVEAMSTHRPYRSALGLDAALAELDRGRGWLYDATVVDACREAFALGLVRMTGGAAEVDLLPDR